MDDINDDELILKAAIEFGPDYLYIIKNSTLGRTLLIDAGTRLESREVRKKVPMTWNGLYTVVLYDSRTS